MLAQNLTWGVVSWRFPLANGTTHPPTHPHTHTCKLEPFATIRSLSVFQRWFYHVLSVRPIAQSRWMKTELVTVRTHSCFQNLPNSIHEFHQQSSTKTASQIFTWLFKRHFGHVWPTMAHPCHPVQHELSKISGEQVFAVEADLVQGHMVPTAVRSPLERLAAGHPSIVPEIRAVIFSWCLVGCVETELQNTSCRTAGIMTTGICCVSFTISSRDSGHPQSWNCQFLKGIRQRLPFRSARP